MVRLCWPLHTRPAMPLYCSSWQDSSEAIFLRIAGIVIAVGLAGDCCIGTMVSRTLFTKVPGRDEDTVIQVRNPRLIRAFDRIQNLQDSLHLIRTKIPFFSHNVIGSTGHRRIIMAIKQRAKSKNNGYPQRIEGPHRTATLAPF